MTRGALLSYLIREGDINPQEWRIHTPSESDYWLRVSMYF